MSEIAIRGPEWQTAVQEIKRAADGAWVVADHTWNLAPPGSLVKTRLERLAEDTGLSFGTLQNRRSVAGRWPKHSRRRECSFEVHAILAALEDRFEVIQPGMTVNEAREVAQRSTSSRGGQPAPTVLSILAELVEIRRRIQASFRLTVPMELGQGQKESMLDDLTEIRYILDQFYSYLAGETLDETLDKILKEA